MASTVILMLDRRQAKKGGLYPISIVINFKGSRSYINLKRSVHPDFWDQETCRVLKGAKVSPKLEVPQVNIYIQGKLTDAQRIVGGLEQTGEIDQLSHSELRTRWILRSN